VADVDECGCGRTIDQPATGRRRLKCSTCSPFRPRNRKVQPLPGPSATVPTIGVGVPLPALSGPGRLEAATLAELEAAGRASTSAGVEALHLAQLLDRGGYTAAGAASLAKARRESMVVALAGAKVAADDVDEMARRREDKARRAGA
jgi:hypothetical protein